MSRLTQFIRELHRRSVWQVLGIYGVGAWLAYEVILGLTEGGVLPDWFPGIAVGLFIIGLPVVLATAFVQEGVSGGPEPEPESDPGAESPEDGSAEATGDGFRPANLFTWRKAIAAGVFAFVLVGLVAVTATFLGPDNEAPTTERSIAVLPLENMSPDPDDEYFTNGIHEEIITRLFRIADLRTLARASVTGFSADERPLPEIADALGVNYLLVGSVRRSGQRSRVSVSLVEPRSGEQLWADTYEASGTDVFAVQASIAENVASALEAELTAGTRERLTELPTVSAEAYDDYLRAQDAQTERYGRESLETALELYESAVRKDPDFALAHAHLGIAHTQYYWFHYEHTEDRLDRARRHIDRALELDPELPEAHLALARYYYWGRLAYDEALRELERAEAGLPGDPELFITRGSVYRRAGQFDRAIQAYRRAVDVDPRYWEGWWNLAETYWLVRRFQDALETAERAAEVGLNVADVWAVKANIRLRGLGQPQAALATLDSVPTGLATGEYRPDLIRNDAHRFLRNYRAGLAATDSTTVTNQFVVRPGVLVRAELHSRLGNARAAAAAYDSARGRLEALRETSPDDVRVLGALALAYAGLDQPDRALELAARALELLPPEREAWRGAVRVLELAEVQTMTGRYDDAVQNLEWLLTHPSPLSVEGLRLDPTWDPLREREDFRKILENHGG